ncbi:choline/carnitine O-acyltransferase [Micrococcus sp.]|uniref:choline/carnitine O-acyltransferase n=1 Tax=Micrococcus sp. TaxID=1271 RepID=UPI002A91F3DD|nr:choline/carnitine O-acyltransferase [Micrococcus sp.]MDY6054541.1 choline/carnitine O-acyltransferase [Micrococcus sp.]
MKPLPVPALDATLERLERAVAGVVDDRTLAATRERIAAAHLAGGPAQRALEAFAARQDAAGGNWMARAWLGDYLAVRDPLPLSTNVTFQVGGDFGAPGIDRAARFLHRAAAVHLAQSRGRTVPEVDARGTVLDPAQWACLDGGLRHPRSEQDVLIPGPGVAEGREIGLIRAGRLFVVPAADDAGRPLPEAWFASAVRAVVEATEADGATEATAAGGAGEDGLGLGFVALSVLGSRVLAAPLERLLEDEHNSAAYRRLAATLFTCTIVDEPADVDHGAAERLRRATVTPGRAWVYKPISYGVSLTDGWIALHCEHSTVDGATLVEVIRRIQAGAGEAGGGPVSGTGPGSGNGPALGEAPGPEVGAHVVLAELTWRVGEGLAAELRCALADYRERAARFRVDVVRVPRPDVSGLGMRVSADFLQQAVMALAQQRAFGRVRSVYESVDMREHVAGRTECLRPVTPAMAALAEVLADGVHSAQDDDGAPTLRALFTQALDAHRDWVKACKSGAGVDRHLWGLGKAVEGTLAGTSGRADDRTKPSDSSDSVNGADAPGSRADHGPAVVGEEAAAVVRALLADPGVRAAREDFLSTTSIGGAEQIVRYAFAPSVPEGYGVSYTPSEDEFEYCVSSWSGAREGFLAQLGPAAAVLAELVDDLSAPGPAQPS